MSNERFNRIQRMVVATELANLFSVQSDFQPAKSLAMAATWQ